MILRLFLYEETKRLDSSSFLLLFLHEVVSDVRNNNNNNKRIRTKHTKCGRKEREKTYTHVSETAPTF